MKKSVYIVECSSGSWDSYHSWISGIFENPQDAENLKTKLNDEYKRILDECPVKGNPDDMSDEDEIKYIEHFRKYPEYFREWNEAEVKEYALNEEIKK